MRADWKFSEKRVIKECHVLSLVFTLFSPRGVLCSQIVLEFFVIKKHCLKFRFVMALSERHAFKDILYLT